MFFNFPASERLKKHELREVFKSGKRYGDGFLTLIVLRKEQGPGKAGFIVRKSRHSAVARNRYKRLLREAYRLNRHKISGYFWIAAILTRQEEELQFARVEEFFVKVCKKSGIIP